VCYNIHKLSNRSAVYEDYKVFLAETDPEKPENLFFIGVYFGIGCGGPDISAECVCRGKNHICNLFR
jgi:hypothetical protein